MPFDYKKEYKEFYMPPKVPTIITVPPMNFIAVRGEGDPNVEDGAYKLALGLVYGIAFTIKMSKKGNHEIEGYYDYVVPPLEGFWWQEGLQRQEHRLVFSYSAKGTLNQTDRDILSARYRFANANMI